MIMVILKKMMGYIQRLTIILCTLLFIYGCVMPPLYKEKKTVFKLSKETSTEAAFTCVLDNVQIMYQNYINNDMRRPSELRRERTTKTLTLDYNKGYFELGNYKTGDIQRGVIKVDSVFKSFRKGRKLILYEKMILSFHDSKITMIREDMMRQIQNCLDNIQ